MPKVNKLERTAYHEGGHAVAAYLLKRRFTGISIVPDDDDGSLGRCTYDKWRSKLNPEYDDGPVLRNLVETRVMTALAGIQAEAELTRRRNWVGANSDLRSAANLLSYISGSTAEHTAYQDWLWERTGSLIRDPQHWAMIQALASALLTQHLIGERKARAIIREAQQAWVNEQIELANAGRCSHTNSSPPSAGTSYQGPL